MFTDSMLAQSLTKATAALPLSFLDRAPEKRRKFGASLGTGVEDQLVDSLFDRLSTLRNPAHVADATWVAGQDSAQSFTAKAHALRLAKAERARLAAPPAPVAKVEPPPQPAMTDPVSESIRAALYPAEKASEKPDLKLRLVSSVMDLSALVICPPVGAAMLGISLWRGSDVTTSARVLALTGTLIGLMNLALPGQVMGLL